MSTLGYYIYLNIYALSCMKHIAYASSVKLSRDMVRSRVFNAPRDLYNNYNLYNNLVTTTPSERRWRERERERERELNLFCVNCEIIS